MAPGLFGFIIQALIVSTQLLSAGLFPNLELWPRVFWPRDFWPRYFWPRDFSPSGFFGLGISGLRISGPVISRSWNSPSGILRFGFRRLGDAALPTLPAAESHTHIVHLLLEVSASHVRIQLT